MNNFDLFKDNYDHIGPMYIIPNNTHSDSDKDHKTSSNHEVKYTLKDVINL